jgi:hypothetical protein
MAVLKDKLKDITKKVANQISQVSNNNTSNNVNSSNEPSWIGSGVSPRTGEVTYGGSANTGTAISNGSSYNEDLQRLKRLQQEANVQQLKAQKDKTLQALAEREATVKPTFQNQRNATSAQSQRSARSFNEYLANRGLTNSGAGAQAEINRASTLQNNLAAINTAETNELNEIARARANAEADFANNLAIANSQIEADYFSKLVEENQRQRLIDEQLKQQALGQYSGDYQARINELLAQGYAPNSREILQLGALKGNKELDFNNGTYRDNALQQILAGNINYNTARYAGFNSVDEAIRYYNDAKAAAEEKARLEAEEKAWNRYVEGTKLNNDILQTQYNINKPYYKPAGENGGEVYNLKDVLSILNNVDSTQAQALIDGLRNDGSITQGTADAVYNMNPTWIKTTPEQNIYNQIAQEVGNTKTVQQAEEVIYKYYQQGVDEGIIQKLMDDLKK